MNDRGTSLNSLRIDAGDFHGDLRAPGDVGKIVLKSGDFGSTIDIGGALGVIKTKAGSIGGTINSDVSIKKIDVRGGNLSAEISAPSVGKVKVKNGAVTSPFSLEAGTVKGISVSGGNFSGELDISGALGSLKVKAYKGAGGSILDSDIDVGGLLKKVQVAVNVRRTDIQAGTLGAVKIGGQLGSSSGASYFIRDNAGPVDDDDLWKLTVGAQREVVSGTKSYLDS